MTEQTAPQTSHLASANVNEPNILEVRNYLLGLQQKIVNALQDLERQSGGCIEFVRDEWQKNAGELIQGDGITRIIEDASVFERAGCGFSHVRGIRLPASASEHRPELAGLPFEALGVSLVFHPRNPYVPTVHMNVRMLSVKKADGMSISWFGGGMDLTPYYGFEEDARHFHQVCHDSLAPFGADYYPCFKKWCDDYFYLPHRGEQRGIGGIFYDDFSELGFEQGFALMRSVGDHFLKAYLPIVQRRLSHSWGEQERNFQLYRRGRYVEFNLIYDRGTHFGLQSGGRTESILLSMPPQAKWAYQRQDEAGSPELELTQKFLQRRDWLADCPEK